jgi:hypothetical protein
MVQDTILFLTAQIIYCFFLSYKCQEEELEALRAAELADY